MKEQSLYVQEVCTNKIRDVTDTWWEGYSKSCRHCNWQTVTSKSEAEILERIVDLWLELKCGYKRIFIITLHILNHFRKWSRACPLCLKNIHAWLSDIQFCWTWCQNCLGQFIDGVCVCVYYNIPRYHHWGFDSVSLGRSSERYLCNIQSFLICRQLWRSQDEFEHTLNKEEVTLTA